MKAVVPNRMAEFCSGGQIISNNSSEQHTVKFYAASDATVFVDTETVKYLFETAKVLQLLKGLHEKGIDGRDLQH